MPHPCQNDQSIAVISGHPWKDPLASELERRRWRCHPKRSSKQKIMQMSGQDEAQAMIMESVTFDLYAFPHPGPRTILEARQLLEARGEGLRFDSETKNGSLHLGHKWLGS